VSVSYVTHLHLLQRQVEYPRQVILARETKLHH